MSDDKAPDMIAEAHKLAREIDDDQELLRRLQRIKTPPTPLKDKIIIALVWLAIIAFLVSIAHRADHFDIEAGGKIYFIHKTHWGFSSEKLAARINGADVEIQTPAGEWVKYEFPEYDEGDRPGRN